MARPSSKQRADAVYEAIMATALQLHAAMLCDSTREARAECRRLGRSIVSHGQEVVDGYSEAKQVREYERCKTWLKKFLATVPRAACELYGEADLEGFSTRMVQRALKDVKAVRRIGGGWRKKLWWEYYISENYRTFLASAAKPQSA